MGKEKYEVKCEQCGYVSPKWLGRCPDCGEWNTFREEVFRVSSSTLRIASKSPQLICNISSSFSERFSTGISELDCVLGGGIVPGSLILLGGEPGVGKSTLLLQAAQNIARMEKVLIISGEESPSQVRMRAERLGALSENLYLLAETDIESLREQIISLQPKMVIVDSIQTVFHPEIPSPPGSLTQIRETTASFAEVAKEKNLPIFLIGHVTKDGAIAGPRALEHMVDTVLYFEGDSHLSYRMVRAVKNRFGSTNEIGVFEMKAGGLQGVANPSAAFLAERCSSPGSVVIATREGTRALLVEVQALITASQAALPRRLVAGLDYNRALLILAILEKRTGLRLGEKDVFISVAGGLKIQEPAADLGIALAVTSAYKDTIIPPEWVIFGEVGLGGEVRTVTNTEERVKEAKRLGFEKILMPFQKGKVDSGMKVYSVKNLKEALKYSEQ